MEILGLKAVAPVVNRIPYLPGRDSIRAVKKAIRQGHLRSSWSRNRHNLGIPGNSPTNWALGSYVNAVHKTSDKTDKEFSRQVLGVPRWGFWSKLGKVDTHFNGAEENTDIKPENRIHVELGEHRWWRPGRSRSITKTERFNSATGSDTETIPQKSMRFQLSMYQTMGEVLDNRFCRKRTARVLNKTTRTISHMLANFYDDLARNPANANLEKLEDGMRRHIQLFTDEVFRRHGSKKGRQLRGRLLYAIANTIHKQILAERSSILGSRLSPFQKIWMDLIKWPETWQVMRDAEKNEYRKYKKFEIPLAPVISNFDNDNIRAVMNIRPFNIADEKVGTYTDGHAEYNPNTAFQDVIRSMQNVLMRHNNPEGLQDMVQSMIQSELKRLFNLDADQEIEMKEHQDAAKEMASYLYNITSHMQRYDRRAGALGDAKPNNLWDYAKNPIRAFMPSTDSHYRNRSHESMRMDPDSWTIGTQVLDESKGKKNNPVVGTEQERENLHLYNKDHLNLKDRIKLWAYGVGPASDVDKLRFAVENYVRSMTAVMQNGMPADGRPARLDDLENNLSHIAERNVYWLLANHPKRHLMNQDDMTHTQKVLDGMVGKVFQRCASNLIDVAESATFKNGVAVPREQFADHGKLMPYSLLYHQRHGLKAGEERPIYGANMVPISHTVN